MIVNDSILKKIVDSALSKGADFVEVYLEDTHRNQFGWLGGRPDKAISGHTLGAGIRLFQGTRQVYTFTNNLSEEGLLRATENAASALKAGGRGPSAVLPQAGPSQATSKKITDSDENWKRLKQMDEAARGTGSLITQVEGNLVEVRKQVQVFNSEGVHRSDQRNYLNAIAQAFAEENGQKEAGFDRVGFLGQADDWHKVDFAQLARDAAEQAVRILRAEWAPAGEMPVLIDSGFGGVIFHEACGHGLETTSIAKKASVFYGKLGEAVANPCVTAIDDGTRDGDYGSLAMDDEGESTRKTVLIENGVLKSYLVDKMGARKTGYNVTGSGRRQDYRFAPTSRMRNTYIAAGHSSFEEMLKDIDYGIYAKKLGGGSVSPATGSYNFAVPEAYLVRGGKIEKQIKGASLIGTGIETLQRIVKVGNNLELAPGTCGSISGWVPVTVGQPSLLVSKLTVGGKAGA
ncbi:MAG: TldD/PmbA family protein [Bdellovibrionales bacterium]